MKANFEDSDRTTLLDVAEAKSSWEGPGADLELLFAQRAEALARSGRRPERGREHLVFVLGKATFALDLTHVISVVAPRFKTLVPGTPPYLAEVVELGGRLLPLFRLDRFLGLKTEKDPPSKYLVLESHGRRLGLSVHRFLAVENLDVAELTPLEPNEGGEIFSGMTPTMMLVVDGSRLFEILRLAD